jgi:glycosyltransferase involved in cell wall biosynthesis
MKKIIDIMSHPPNYKAYENEPRPKVNWDIPDNSWVGIWGYDGANLIANAVKKISDSVEYEIWQPDLRADKIYAHRFESGVVHKLIPAYSKKLFEGLKLTETIYSQMIIDELNGLISKRNDLVLVIDGAPSEFNINLYYNFYKKIPILNLFSGDPGLFFNNNYLSKNFLKKIHNKIITSKRNRYFSRINNAMVGNIPSSINLLTKRFNINVYTNLMGVDFNFWSIDKSKCEARKFLNIPEKPFIIFSSSRLNKLKQVDKLVEVLAKLKEYDFICYISGLGYKDFEEYLVKLIDQNGLNDKIHLLGFIDDETLKNYYLAADLFVTLSQAEGGPVSAWKAMALEIPVFTTNTGNVIEVFKQFNAGLIVDVFNYKEWEFRLKEVLEGNKVNVIPRSEVEELASWKNVARCYLNIYTDIYQKFYRRN